MTLALLGTTQRINSFPYLGKVGMGSYKNRKWVSAKELFLYEFLRAKALRMTIFIVSMEFAI